MTDAAFRSWIQTLPSCITGRGDWIEQFGERRNEACHVRRAKTFGTGFKADLSCVPLTHLEHDIQTRNGELACLMEFLSKGEIRRLFYGKLYEERVSAAKAWFDAQAEKYRARWMRETPEGRKWVESQAIEVTA
jgi:hypothetical protein